ncbi:hypothetical protein CMI37_03765 [Candidatus Pacearchaeota archaeon]|nr:hypothetical protein [Candidatus Pacearchaeota archaeon]|tara:strand:- start:809 stop:1045 length:237 start_codon:yes stop_codon:yes gene_type:complete
MKKLIILLTMLMSFAVLAKPPVKSKFYKFDEHMIDGQVRSPSIIYTNIREKVKFERLLSLKKSFMRKLFDTAKERIFK